MHIDRRLLAALVTAGVVAGCGSDHGSTSSASSIAVTTSAATTSTAGATVVATHGSSTTTLPSTDSTTGPDVATQIALWPAADVVFATPEDAASDFLANAFAPGPVIGPTRVGDQGSAEIDVFASAEAGTAIGEARSTLQLRQQGAANGWFVIRAVSNVEIIATPEAGAVVPAGPLMVTGAAQGFEASVGLSAFVVGHAEPPLDIGHTQAGNFGAPLPFEVTLDLSGAAPGDTVVILVHGGVGLETDPGDFSAIAVTVAG